MNLTALRVDRKTTIRQALSALEAGGSGVLLLVRTDGVFERTVTDGDLRRLLLSGEPMEGTLAGLPEIDSIVVDGSCSKAQALDLMNSFVINHLPVVDDQRHVLRLLTRWELDEQILLSTPHMGSWEREYVEEAFRTNWIAPLGPNVDAFERELAAHVGVGHAAAVSSGTAAIHLALRILDVGPGDLVFCSSLTFAASVNPIIYQGAVPVFVDSEPESWNMSPVALEKAFAWCRRDGRLPKAVIVVNLYGQSADMDLLLDICNRYSVPLIEDAAESLGARYKEKASGTFGVMGIYSFNGNKIITTSGGGMLISENEDYIKQARFLATQARDPAPHYEHTQIGFNYRMSNILAGVGRGQLRVLDDRVKARRRIFERYRDGLGDVSSIKWMPEPEWSYSTHWLTVCLLEAGRASELIQRLTAERIEARPIWKPMHMQPVFSKFQSFDHGTHSVSRSLFELGICLPSGSNMTDGQQEKVVALVRQVLT